MSLLFNPQVLWLYSNNITWIEAGAFSNLRVLEELDLSDNPSLRRLDGGAFRGLERLQSLHMHRCHLTELPADLFLKLYSLQFLYLQENQLSHLADGLFSDLVNLTHLFLHGNRIRVLSENAFRGLVNLDRLLLHDNRIRQVHRRAFRDLGRLTILYLFNNSLQELPGQTLKDTSSVQFLRLNDNPWTCGCEARSLWEWFRKARISSSDLTCSSPVPRKGQDLRFLRELDFALCPVPDPGSLAGTSTTTFSTKTRWWFSKNKPASSSKSHFHKSSETLKAYPFTSVKHPSSSSSSFSSKYDLTAEEAAYPSWSLKSTGQTMAMRTQPQSPVSSLNVHQVTTLPFSHLPLHLHFCPSSHSQHLLSHFTFSSAEISFYSSFSSAILHYLSPAIGLMLINA